MYHIHIYVAYRFLKKLVDKKINQNFQDYVLLKNLQKYQDILDKRLAWDAEERFCFARLSSHLFERFVPIAKEMYLCYAYSRLEDGKVIINAPKSESEFLALALAKAKGLSGQENKGNSPPRLRR